jgi:hypothetical protein
VEGETLYIRPTKLTEALNRTDVMMSDPSFFEHINKTAFISSKTSALKLKITFRAVKGETGRLK